MFKLFCFFTTIDYESIQQVERIESKQDVVALSHLKADDWEENTTGNVDAESEEDHGHTTELSQQVEDDEGGGQEPAAAPRDVHVLALLGPLDPHPEPIFEEGGDETESS